LGRHTDRQTDRQTDGQKENNTCFAAQNLWCAGNIRHVESVCVRFFSTGNAARSYQLLLGFELSIKR